MSRQSRPPPPRPAGRLLPLLAAMLTAILRIWFVLSLQNHPYSQPSPQIIDSWYYHNQALSIISGNFWGNEVFFLRPLLPYLLAPFYALFGARLLPFLLFQTVLASISSLLLWDITRRIFNRLAGAIAAFSFALTGILVFYTGTLLYVELTVFLTLLFIWLVLIAGKSRWRWLPAGLVFGLLTICRPELLVLLPALLIWLHRSHTPVRHLLTLSLAALTVIAIVPIRNYLVARDPVLFTAHSGINFYYGNNPSADGTWQPVGELDRAVGFSHEKLKQVSRVINGKVLPWSQASGYWLGQGIEFILSHPLRFLRLLGRKLLLHCANYEIPNNYYPETVRPVSLPLRLSFLNFGFALALGVLGMVWAWQERRRAAPLYLTVAAFLLSSLIFYVLSRLRAPTIPFLLAFAGFAVSEIWSAARRRDYRRLVLGLTITVLLYAGSSLIPVNRREYSGQAWAQIGNIHLQNRQARLARHAFERALSIDSTSVSARYSLIELLCAAGRKNEAALELRRLARDAAGTAAGNTLVHLASARVAIAWQDFPVAAATYQAILAGDSTNATAWYMLGLVYISTGDYQLAADALNRTLRLDPANTDAAAALERLNQRLAR